MPDQLKRLATSIAALCLVVGIVVFSVAAPARGACSVGTGLSRSPAISIQAPAAVSAGGELCFQVTCFGGAPSVMVEVNEVKVPVTVSRTEDPSVYTICGKVPGGASGSVVVITAVSSSGGIATRSVLVH